MEIPKFFSNAGCSALSDSIDFANGMKKVGSIGLKVGALAAAAIAMLKLYRYATQQTTKEVFPREQLLPRMIQWNSKGVTVLPFKTVDYTLAPVKDKKDEYALVRRTQIRIPSLGDTLLITAILGLSAIATHAFFNAAELGLERSSNYLCNKE